MTESPPEHRQAIDGLTMICNRGLFDRAGNVHWRMLILELQTSGMSKAALAAMIGIQANSLDRLLVTEKNQPSFATGCRILAFFAKIQKSPKN